MFYFAAAHAAGIRVGIALLGLVVFGTVATTRWGRPVPVVSVLVLCLIVAGWLFGATLVWGTGYATKIRWSASWTFNGQAWQWSALLAVALIGVLCLGLAVRAFARGQPRRGWALSAGSGAAFVLWSAVVRYSVVAAIFVFAVGVVAVAFLSPRQLAIAASTQRRGGRQPAVIPLLLGTIVIGFVWAFFAFGWLVVGPEGQQTCNCWADRYNDWQYQVQFLVALGGALSLAAAAVSYLMRRPAALRVTGTITAAAICGWIGFLVTGSG